MKVVVGVGVGGGDGGGGVTMSSERTVNWERSGKTPEPSISFKQFDSTFHSSLCAG